MGGYPIRLKVESHGRVELELRYEDELPSLDLSWDPDTEKATSAADAWDPNAKRGVAPGVLLDGGEQAAFLALDTALRERLGREMRALRIRNLCSRKAELTLRFGPDVNRLDDPERSLVSALHLARDVAVARGAHPSPLPTAPIDPSRPFAGWPHLSKEQKWARSVSFGGSLARRLGGRMVTRPEDREVEVRWVEEGNAIGVSLVLSEEKVWADALAPGAKGSFMLWRNPDVVVDQTHVGDAWDADGYVFFGKDVYLSGSEEDVREEAAPLRALPDELVEELVRTMDEIGIDLVILDEGELDARIGPIVFADDGTTAVRVAKLLGRIARALPRDGDASPVRDRVARCRYCRALWFPAPGREACTHCGAPA